MPKPKSNSIVSVILAAGKGTRMSMPHLHKVCYQIGGRPVIVRSIEALNRCGVSSHCVVIGELMEQVVKASSQAEAQVFYAYQPEQHGTGHATRCATNTLKAMGYAGDVLLMPGDKVIDEAVIERLIDTYRKADADFAMVVGDVEHGPGLGRVLTDDAGNVVGIVEATDCAKAQVISVLKRLSEKGDVSAAEAESLALAYLKQESKAAKSLGSLWTSVKSGAAVTRGMIYGEFAEADSISVGGRRFTAQELREVNLSNQFIYLIKAPLLYSALDRLGADNAQKEEYLTDIVGMLAAEGRKIVPIPVDYPEQVMAFNTPEEFRAIEDYFAGLKRPKVEETPKTIRPASEWLRAFEDTGGPARKHLSEIYGGDPSLVEQKCAQLVRMLRNYVRRFSDDPVVITRAPGRVNIMGRHVDHQGGFANLIALDRDFYLVVGAREDRQVVLHNMRERDLPGRSFDADDVIANYDGGDWLRFVDSSFIRERLEQNRGDWSHYVIAPTARFQAAYPHLPLKGMNMVAAGNVPMAAGLSSSSAMVVAVAEAIAHINDIDISPEQFVQLCGEGEWYVGTRGGSADHAAMKFAQSGRVINVSFLPFRMVDSIPFPTQYRFVVCNSQLRAHKTTGARDTFNHRAACYRIGRELFKLEFPEHAPKIEHLRDINARNLGVSYPELLRMLKHIPAHMTRDEVLRRLPDGVGEGFLNSHDASINDYPVRGAVMFGLSECERGRQCAQLVRNARIEQLGRMMNISHDGDRVVSWTDKDHCHPAVADYSDAAMDDLIARAEQGLESAELVMQPGAYGCSVPDIDWMIDIAKSHKGVLGAQILGAGLGGCILVLIPADGYPALERRMIRDYYEPRGLQPDMFACRPVAGSRVISI